MMAHNIDLLTLQEMAIASALPKLAPAFATCTVRVRPVLGGVPSWTGPEKVDCKSVSGEW